MSSKNSGSSPRRDDLRGEAARPRPPCGSDAHASAGARRRRRPATAARRSAQATTQQRDDERAAGIMTVRLRSRRRARDRARRGGRPRRSGRGSPRRASRDRVEHGGRSTARARHDQLVVLPTRPRRDAAHGLERAPSGTARSRSASRRARARRRAVRRLRQLRDEAAVDEHHEAIGQPLDVADLVRGEEDGASARLPFARRGRRTRTRPSGSSAAVGSSSSSTSPRAASRPRGRAAATIPPE